MTLPPSGPQGQLRTQVLQVLTGPPILAFLPAASLAAYWLGGEPALILVSLGSPLLYAAVGSFGQQPSTRHGTHDSVTGLVLRDGFSEAVAQVFDQTRQSDMKSACFMLELDDFHRLSDRQGQAAADLVAQRTGERLIGVLRDGDTVARIGDARFAICLKAVRQLDLEACIQLAGRLQTASEEAVAVDGATVYMSCSVGFCLRSRSPGPIAEDWSNAALAALTEAQKVGPSGIRAYSAELQRRSRARTDLRDDAAAALENGQIQPWYQPQISTDTGQVTGFEALARWTHPVHGAIPPDAFLPVLEDAGLTERMGEVMLYHALTALKAWDSAGVDVPRVGVNFAAAELHNPRLVDKVSWELDRFDITPERLSVEILETVVTDGSDDVVRRNVAGLAELGCRIDLDDFGTGHASIASIRRFSVSRIKIDRSFVMKADRDPEQQKLIGAILTMAERLDLETLAEGVESVGEHALLAQLGCNHVQGFGIARPMPFDHTLDWISGHQTKLQDAPRIGGQAC